LGIHFTTVQLWERGVGGPGVKPLPEIIRFLGYVPFDCVPTPGGKIAFLRRCCGMTQKKLAVRIDCNPETLWRWETNLTATSRKHRLANGILHRELKKLSVQDFVIAAITQ
jgi:DNA-binding transcriptional regulator YiaG